MIIAHETWRERGPRVCYEVLANFGMLTACIFGWGSISTARATKHETVSYGSTIKQRGRSVRKIPKQSLSLSSPLLFLFHLSSSGSPTFSNYYSHLSIAMRFTFALLAIPALVAAAPAGKRCTGTISSLNDVAAAQKCTTVSAPPPRLVPRVARS